MSVRSGRREGSGAASDYCPMCARRWVPWGSVPPPIPQHNRRDILAELARGDFEEPSVPSFTPFHPTYTDQPPGET